MVDSDLVLIPGAGRVGRTVLDQLRAEDVPVRAMVRRDDDRAAALRALGADGGSSLSPEQGVGSCRPACAYSASPTAFGDPAHSS